MGEANRRCKDRNQRILLAIEETAKKRLLNKQKELERIAAMTPEEKEAEMNKRQRQVKTNLLLASALVIGKSPF